MIELLILILILSPFLGVSAWLKSKKSPLRRFEDALQASIAEGIITLEQKNRILEKLSTRALRVPFRAVSLILIFAALFVVAGLSLLIAHNWDHIGPATRVMAFVFLFYGLGEFTLWVQAKHPDKTLPLFIVWFFFPILGIGLYAQTFQLSGDFILPYLTWAAISLPLVGVLKKASLTYLHVLLLIALLFCGGFYKNNILSILNDHDTTPTLPWLYQILLLLLIIFECFRLKPLPQRFQVFTLVAAWIFSLFSARTYFSLHEPIWFFIAAAALSSFWLMMTFIFKLPLRERTLPYLGMFFSMYAMTFLWDVNSKINFTSSLPGTLLILAMSGAALAYFLLKNPHELSHDPTWNRLFQALVVTPILLSLCITFSNEFGLKVIALIANILLVLGALLAMWHGSMHAEELSINLGAAILLLILITRFVDIMGDMVQSGLGLIVSGLFLSSVAYGLSQARKHLLKKSNPEAL